MSIKKFWVYEPRLVDMSELKKGDIFRGETGDEDILLVATTDALPEPARGEGCYSITAATYRERGQVAN